HLVGTDRLRRRGLLDRPFGRVGRVLERERPGEMTADALRPHAAPAVDRTVDNDQERVVTHPTAERAGEAGKQFPHPGGVHGAPPPPSRWADNLITTLS